MAKALPRPTPTTYVAQLALDETHVVEITITGQDMTYDERGAIVSGDVYDIAIGHLHLNGSHLVLDDITKASGLNIEAASLGEMFGDTFWNNPKLIFSAYEKFANLHEGITQSYFSPFKSYAFGSEWSDDLTGSKFADLIEGNKGDDDLHGGAAQDTIRGGAGDDAMWGDGGNDLLVDTEGANSFDGGAGHDSIVGGAGADQIFGGKGNDFLAGGGGGDMVWGGRGNDVFVFDVKTSGTTKIADFGRDDQLLNLRTGSAEEAYKYFVQNAHQDGRNVVYDEGDLHLVLRGVKLSQLDLHNFADPGLAHDLGLF